MKDKILYVVGGLLVVVLLYVLFNVSNNVSKLNDKVNFLAAGSGEQMVGGTTNYDALSLGGALTVGGALNVTGASTLTGATTQTGALTVAGAVDVPTFTQGGGITASSTTNTSETLLASDFDVENVITYTPNTGNTTLTLPATSTLASFIPNAGDVRTVYIKNATSTAATVLTLAGGTGMDVQEPTGAALTIEGLDWGILQFVRLANTDIAVFFDEFQEAD